MFGHPNHIFVRIKHYEPPYYAIIPPSPIIASLSGTNIYPQNPFLEHRESVIFADCKRPSFTAIQSERKFYGFVYFNHFVLDGREFLTDFGSLFIIGHISFVMLSLLHQQPDLSLLHMSLNVNQRQTILKKYCVSIIA